MKRVAELVYTCGKMSAVSTRPAAGMLLMANEKDPLFLQVKEAGASVLEPYAARVNTRTTDSVSSAAATLCNMQSASGLFLPWTEGQFGRHYYVRQLKDMKINPLGEIFTPVETELYAEQCGRRLARARARSGSRQNQWLHG